MSPFYPLHFICVTVPYIVGTHLSPSFVYPDFNIVTEGVLFRFVYTHLHTWAFLFIRLVLCL